MSGCFLLFLMCVIVVWCSGIVITSPAVASTGREGGFDQLLAVFGSLRVAWLFFPSSGD